MTISKRKAIGYSFEFLTKVLNIPLERLAVTVFAGEDNIPRDEVAARHLEKFRDK